MDIKVLATTKPGYQPDLREQELFSGKMAGICYMKDDFATLDNEPETATDKRIVRTLTGGHHSVYDHTKITFYFENVPKLFAMLLNNEKMYTTSEKSARFTEMNAEGLEGELFHKWKDKLIPIITEKYGEQPYFSKFIIDRLANENARYFTSVMTPTSFAHTISLRQLNYYVAWMQNFKNETNPLYQLLVPTADEFCARIEALGLLDSELMNDGKGRGFSLIGKRVREEQFGENYSVNYYASYAMLAQAQRHRTLSYEISPSTTTLFYVPQFLTKELAEEWLEDMYRVADLYPQGKLLRINERGTYENLILKAKERLCTCAQLEVMQNTADTIDRIIVNTTNEQVKQDLEKYAHGARCTSGFKCPTPCGFKPGIDLTRDI